MSQSRLSLLPSRFGLIVFLCLSLPLILGTFVSAQEGGPREVVGNVHPYECDSSECQLPDCHCASVTSPLGADAAHDSIPQFVLFTADDAVQEYTVNTVNYFLGQRRNPNSCPVGMTYFVSLNYTDYHLVTNYYSNQSYEIADHTMTHVFPSESEVNGNLLALNAFSGIPLSSIQGFRAPFLNYTGSSLELLGRSQFTYDSSASSSTRANATNSDAYWPYTLDNGLANDCDLVSDACDGQINIPGMWEIPMYAIFEDETTTTAHLMDPWLDDDSDDASAILRWLRYTFHTHYDGNRQPFGLYSHPIHLADDYPGVASPTAMRNALNEFLDWVQGFNNVWLVTNQQLIAWMQNPVPADQLNDFDALRCQDPAIDEPICNGLNDETENSFVRCQFREFPWNTCYGCPEVPPTPDNPVPPQASSEAGVRHHLPSNCSTQFFDPVENRCLCDDSSCQFIDQTKPIGPNGEPVAGGGTGGDDTESAVPSYEPFDSSALSVGANIWIVSAFASVLAGGMAIGVYSTVPGHLPYDGLGKTT